MEAVERQEQSDWETIVADFGSDEDTQKAIADISRRIGRRLRAIREDRNLGPIAAKNRAIQEARGDWLLFCDDDDWLVDNALTTIDETIRANPDYSIFIFRCQRTDDGEPAGLVAIPAGPLSYRDLLQERITGEHQMVVRREILKQYRFADLLGGEGALWLEVLRQSGPAWFCLRIVKNYRVPGQGHEGITSRRTSRPLETADIYRSHLEKFGDDMLRWCPEKFVRYQANMGYFEILAGRRSSARKAAIAGLRRRPWAPRPWAILTLSFLPRPLVRWTSRFAP